MGVKVRVKVLISEYKGVSQVRLKVCRKGAVNRALSEAEWVNG